MEQEKNMCLKIQFLSICQKSFFKFEMYENNYGTLPLDGVLFNKKVFPKIPLKHFFRNKSLSHSFQVSEHEQA